MRGEAAFYRVRLELGTEGVYLPPERVIDPVRPGSRMALIRCARGCTSGFEAMIFLPERVATDELSPVVLERNADRHLIDYS